MGPAFKKYFSIFLLLAIAGLSLHSQTLIPLNKYIEQRIEREYLIKGLPLLPAFHSYFKEDIEKLLNVDSVLEFNSIKHKSWLGRKFFDESFIQIDSSDYSLHIDPGFNIQAGKDLQGSGLLFTNTRGGIVQGTLGKKFAFATWFYENQSVFPEYWDVLIDSSRVSPGQGRAKRYKKTGWDYAYSGGYISWRAFRHLNLEFGQGKNFVGNGYRSLLLSDASSNYPYLKIDWKYKRFHYVKMFTAYTNLYYPFKDIREFYKKTGTIQYLSINLGKKWQVSFFEMNVWANPDSTGKFKWDVEFLNPVPYLESVVRKDPLNYNSFDGIGFTYNPIRGIQLYGQFVTDEVFNSDYKNFIKLHKFGYQLGFKYYDPFRIQNLYFQCEVNEVEPYTYSQVNPFLAFTHFQQPLTHPLGANFREFIGITNYRYKRFFGEIKGTFANYGADNEKTHWGKDLLKPFMESENYIQSTDPVLFQGFKTDLFTAELKVSYIINPKTNMNITAGFYLRSEKSSIVNNQIQMGYISFQTSLSNLYFDY